jgi:hypothetical protein
LSVYVEEAAMAAPEDRTFTARHWVLIAATAVPVVILLVRAVVEPTERLSHFVAIAALAIAVTSLLHSRRRRPFASRPGS